MAVYGEFNFFDGVRANAHCPNACLSFETHHALGVSRSPTLKEKQIVNNLSTGFFKRCADLRAPEKGRGKAGRKADP